MAGRTILITGASGGIGAALAQRYAAPGVRLLLWGRDPAKLERAAAPCRAKGAVCDLAAFDIRDIDSLCARLAAADSQTPIDLAIFNAGLGGMAGAGAPAEAPDAARATAEVNFLSPVMGAQVIAAAMGARGRGQIVLMGSIAESFPLPMAPTYAATKAGLAMFAEALSIRLKKFGVKVTLVSPGFIDTDMSRQVPEPKPFLISATHAAAIIARRIDAGAARIVVPWQFTVLRGLARVLPRAILHAVLGARA